MPDVQITGVGGDLLEAEGMQPIYRVSDFNVIGLFEVLSQLRRLKRIFNELVTAVREHQPDLILLVDGPDFNLRFAKAVKGLGIPVIYYVSPQIWAWRPQRAKTVASLVDHLMVLFSFEQDFYKNYGLSTTWVGHPLVDELKDDRSREAFFHEQGFQTDKPLVALAPGSRWSEVKRLLPVMAELAHARQDQYQFALPLASTIEKQDVLTLLNGAEVTILPRKMRTLMRHADAAVVASGTATLETGLLRTPMIVGYKLKWLTFLLAKWLVKVPHVALVNIVLGKGVVPELIQGAFEKEHVLPLLDELIQVPERRNQMLEEFDRLESILGGGGASKRAADVIKGFLTA